MATQSRRIEAVEVTCKILDVLADQKSSGVTELADRLDRSKSSMHAYLATLEDQGYVINRDGQYSLSLYHLQLADRLKNRIGNFKIIKDEVNELADTTGEVAQFATLEKDDLVYIYKARGDTAVETRSAVGKRDTLHSTSLGKSILSQLNEDEVRDLLGSEPFPQKTKNTITNYEALFEELETVRENGYATDLEENIMGLHCISAPVVLDDHDVLGAVSVSKPSHRNAGNHIEEEYEDLVIRAANVIQLNTNFS